MQRDNVHATGVVLGGACVLVQGPSGSGKTMLALTLLQDYARERRFAALVADDRLWLRAASGRLVAEAPEPIAGLAERRGFGPAPVAFVRRAVVDVAVRLVDASQAPRLAEPQEQSIAGIDVPVLDLARQGMPGSAAALRAWLGQLGLG